MSMAHTTLFPLSPCKQAQRGMFLPSLAVAVMLAMLILGGFLSLYAERQASSMADKRAEMVGARLSALDDAVKTYATTFFTQIQRHQQVQRNGHTVPSSRVRAPTPDDLYRMDLLREDLASPLVYNGLSIDFSIQLNVPTSGCFIPNCNVTSLVSSTQPMVELHDQSLVDVRRASIAAAVASSGRAGVALPEAPGVFVSKDGVQVAPNPSSSAGLIAITNGYDSRGFLEFDRRDGSLPRTGSINMQDDSGVRHSIRNADDVATQTVSASGRLKTGEFLEFDGPNVVEGAACLKDGLVASGAGGLILSCQSGSWKKAQGSSGGTGIQGFLAPYKGMSISCMTGGTAITRRGVSATVNDSGLVINLLNRSGSVVGTCVNTHVCGNATFTGLGVFYYASSTSDDGGGTTEYTCSALFPNI